MTKDTKHEEEGEILDDVLSDEEAVAEEKKPAEKEPEVDTGASSKGEDKVEAVAVEAEKKDKEEAKIETAAAATSDTKDAKDAKDAKDIKDVKDVNDAKKEDKEEVPPPKPARPLTPRQEAIKSLKEAFPTVEDKYITSHLIASNFHLESAFNALLYLSDPDSVNVDELLATTEELQPPSLPQRRQELTQLEQDELLAKQLDEEYRHKEERRARRQREFRRRRQEGETLDDDDEDDVFTNFVEKDLPQMKEQLSKNIEETKNKFNNWVSGWKKQYSDSQQELNNRQIKKQVREEFEQDPEEVDLQKFHGIKLSDDSEPVTKTKSIKSTSSKGSNETVGRNRALSTDLYGTPKHSQKDKKSSTVNEDDDDFDLSDAA